MRDPSRSWVGALALGVLIAAATATAQAGVADTRHNLSVSGPGTVQAQTETRICVFCHTPHSASTVAQLWNRDLSAAPYTPYASSTLEAAPGQPTGASRLCLGCHDGTIALGSVISEAADIQLVGGVTVLPDGPTRLGTDLMDDHPVSFPYDAALAAGDGELVDPSALPPETALDAGGELQCTTCHDPHDDANGAFLVLPADDDGLCTACHQPGGWTTAAHAALPVAGKRMKAIGSPNACLNCHETHGGEAGARLLAAAREEDGCTPCHGAAGPAADVETDFGRLFVHPLNLAQDVHDPREALPVADAHVECVDCHNPHAARAEAATAPDAPGSLAGVRGLDGDGVEVAEAAYTYEVCYQCHAGSTWRPQPATPRQIVQSDTMLEFDPANPSFHPVEGPGASSDVPSLLAPYTTGSVVTCTDCHRSSDPAAAAGVHGSDYAHILGWNYETTQGTIESALAYELCYRCHDRTIVISSMSWQSHRKHVVNEQFPCNACHDPHGISATQGDAANHTRLMNFDLTYVEPEDGTGLLEFVDNGGWGTCTLKCHGSNHVSKNW